MRKRNLLPWIFILIISLVGCSSSEKTPLGTAKNPIKMYFVPSVEADRVVTGADFIENALHETTGLYFKTAVPTSYAAVIEGMGTNEADIGWLPTFSYLLAHEKFDAEVGLTVLRRGQKMYRGQFFARSDSPIKSLEDLQGKTIAYTDAASTSGYIFSSGLLAQKGIIPKRHFFAGGHPQAVLAVYQGTADAGCSYWAPPDSEGIPMDARRRVADMYPDVYDKVKVIGFTEWIPNGTVTFRKDFPKDIQEQIIRGLLAYIEREEGKKVFDELYNVDGFVRAQNSDYDVVRRALTTLNLNVEDFAEK